MRTYLFVVRKILRLFKLTDHGNELTGNHGLCEGICARGKVALRCLTHAHLRIRTQIQHQVALRTSIHLSPIKINRADARTRSDTSAMRFASIQINLKRIVNRIFWTGGNACATPGTHLGIDWVF